MGAVLAQEAVDRHDHCLFVGIDDKWLLDVKHEPAKGEVGLGAEASRCFNPRAHGRRCRRHRIVEHRHLLR